jgi:type III pantothenate kinase
MQACELLLAVDIGNTHIVLGLFREARLVAHWRLSSNNARTIDESWVMLSTLLRSVQLEPRQITGVALSSVVPDLNFVWIKLSEHYLELDALLVDHETAGVPELRVDEPSTVGADRICNVIAAHHYCQGSAIVIDFGTATTFDVVSRAGAFLGGLILPGPQSALRSLHQNAAKLPKVALAFPPSVIGTSTERAMQSGLLHGAVAQAEGLVRAIREELNDPQIRVLSTGGFGRIISRHSREITEHLPYLVLYGLGLLFSRARGCNWDLPVEQMKLDAEEGGRVRGEL